MVKLLLMGQQISRYIAFTRCRSISDHIVNEVQDVYRLQSED